MVIGLGRLATVKDVAIHVALVDLRYVQRLRDLPVVTFDAYLDASMPEIAALAEQRASLLDDWLAGATAADCEHEVTFQTLTAGTVIASKRSVVTHTLVHGARHWAQVATCLRQRGWRQDWRHDDLAHHRQ